MREVLWFLVVFFLLLSLVQVEHALTGAVVSNTGHSSVCINHPPAVTSINDSQIALGQTFTLQVNASDYENATLLYSDDSALFEITSNGSISFTATTSGTFTPTITVSDGTGCDNENTSRTFTLTIPAEESQTTTPTRSSSGGSAAFSKEQLTKGIAFTISPKKITHTLLINETFSQEIFLQNEGIPLKIDTETTIPEISLTPNEAQLFNEKKFLIQFEGVTEPTTITGELLFTARAQGKEERRTIPLLLDVQTPLRKIDGAIQILEGSEFVGDIMKLAVTLQPLQGEIEETEATVEYVFMNLQNEIIFTTSEKISLQGATSYTKSLPLPPGLEKGTYVVSPRLRAGNTYAVSSELFEIKGERRVPGDTLTPFFFKVVGIVTGSLLLLVEIIFRVRKKLIDTSNKLPLPQKSFQDTQKKI